MKSSSRFTVVALLGLALTAPVAFGDEAHHPEQKVAAGAAPGKPAEPPVQKMKDNTDTLRAQVDKIAKTKDQAERQKLMQEHMQTLREGMMMAGGPGGAAGMGMPGGGMMMDCPMMGQTMGGGMSGDMMQRMQQMEKRMDMMQMMMQQMQKPGGPAR